MADRNRELVPDNWSLVRERALTTGLCSEGWYSEHSGVCRRADRDRHTDGETGKQMSRWRQADRGTARQKYADRERDGRR